MNNKTQSEQKEYYRKEIGACLGRISGAIVRAVHIKNNMHDELDAVKVTSVDLKDYGAVSMNHIRIGGA